VSTFVGSSLAQPVPIDWLGQPSRRQRIWLTFLPFGADGAQGVRRRRARATDRLVPRRRGFDRFEALEIADTLAGDAGLGPSLVC
jgi:hypothetical protein